VGAVVDDDLDVVGALIQADRIGLNASGLSP
jgi:hypothetical protein